MLIFLLAPLGLRADVFVCTDAAGKKSFQEFPCASDESSDQIELKPAQVIQSTNPIPEIQPASEAEPVQKKSRESKPYDFCEGLVAQYKAKSADIKANCKRGRNSYCKQSAEQIEQIEERKFLKTATNQQLNNYNRNNPSGGVVTRLVRQMKMRNCRY